MRARLIVQRILDELEARNADAIERLVIGAAGIAQRQRGHAEVLQRLDPLREDRRDRCIALQIYAAKGNR